MQHEAIVGIEAPDSCGAKRPVGSPALSATNGTVSIRILNAFLSRGK